MAEIKIRTVKSENRKYNETDQKVTTSDIFVVGTIKEIGEMAPDGKKPFLKVVVSGASYYDEDLDTVIEDDTSTELRYYGSSRDSALKTLTYENTEDPSKSKKLVDNIGKKVICKAQQSETTFEGENGPMSRSMYFGNGIIYANMGRRTYYKSKVDEATDTVLQGSYAIAGTASVKDTEVDIAHTVYNREKGEFETDYWTNIKAKTSDALKNALAREEGQPGKSLIAICPYKSYKETKEGDKITSAVAEATILYIV